MSLLALHRSELRREQHHAAKDQSSIADDSAKIARKQADLTRVKTSSRQKTL